MPRLKAWGQVSGAPAHLQLVQGPLPQCVREGLEPYIANLVVVEPMQVPAYCTSNKTSQSGECTCQVSRHGNKAAGRQRTVKWSRAPFPTASARAESPASPIWLPLRPRTCVCHIQQQV